ncbi:MAG: signal peptide peptidase SppA [Planctomycetota bacterium]
MHETTDVENGENDKKSGWIKGCFAVVLVLGVLSAVVFVGLLVFGITAVLMGETETPDGSVPLREVRVSGVEEDPKVAVIPLEGMIYGSAGESGGRTPLEITRARIEKAAQDPQVRGVMLKVDSPGGGITASDILHEELEQLRAGGEGKPVVVNMMDMATSGAYYVSAAADSIIAHPTTLTGSIGVMMPLYDATELMDKIGVESKSLTTGPYKDLGSPFVEKSEKQREKERELLQDLIDQMYERFLEVVASGRDMEMENVREVADGRIFTSETAREVGLIDEVGYESRAVEEIKDLCEVEEVQLVEYRRVLSMADVLAAFAQGGEVSLNLSPEFNPLNAARPMYLWLPRTSHYSDSDFPEEL